MLFDIDGSDVAERDGNPEAVRKILFEISDIFVFTRFRSYFALENMSIPAIK